MGIQMMGTQGNGQQSLLHTCQLTRQNSWYRLTLNEVENQLEKLGKPLGSMNLDELLENAWITEESQGVGGMDIPGSTSSSSLQHQASLTLARALSAKTVDQVWKEIQKGQMMRGGEEVKVEGKETTLAETTLEDFLVQAGLFAEASLSSTAELVKADPVTPECMPQKLLSTSVASTAMAPDTISSGKRESPDALQRSIERRLRRKIKNRESAARSRARKQAYQNELVNKVSHLEEVNLKLKKEKEFDNMFPCQPSSEKRYQLRRTSSATL